MRSIKRAREVCACMALTSDFGTFTGANFSAPQNREVLISESLARELGARPGESLLVQIEKPSDVPIESLYGQKDELGRTLRLTMRETLSPEQLGEFSTSPQQTAVRAVFVPLELLQRELDQPDKVNTILLSRSPGSTGAFGRTATANDPGLIEERVQFEDYNINVRPLDQQRGMSLERTSTLLDDNLAKTAIDVANTLNLKQSPFFRTSPMESPPRDRTIPYSLITAIDDATFESLKVVKPIQDASGKTPIILNDWAARDLNAKPGDAVSLEYFIWHEDGKLETKQAEFQLVAVVPISGLAADRDLVPEYPGISESPSLSDWDPPFPVDLESHPPTGRRILGPVSNHTESLHSLKRRPKAVAVALWQTHFDPDHCWCHAIGPGLKYVSESTSQLVDTGDDGYIRSPGAR